MVRSLDPEHLELHAQHASLYQQVLHQPVQTLQRLMCRGQQVVAIVGGELDLGVTQAAYARASGVHRSWLTAESSAALAPGERIQPYPIRLVNWLVSK